MENESEPLSYQGYRTLVNLAHTNHPEWRSGQAYFNVLHRVRPDLSERVRATNLDPFYKVTYNGIHPFLKFVEENW